jgi:Protein of unknown function (DUF1579)
MRRSFAIVISTLLLTALAVSQTGPPTPAPELKKLDYFLGNWTSSGDAKPGPMGPGGKFTESGKGEWMEGGFFLVINSNFQGAGMGTSKGVAYMGYDPQDKVYTYDAFSSSGENIHSKGTVDGDTWNWTNEFKMGAQTVKARYTMKILSPDAYTFKFEMSQDGTKWDTAMEGKATKNK